MAKTKAGLPDLSALGLNGNALGKIAAKAAIKFLRENPKIVVDLVTAALFRALDEAEKQLDAPPKARSRGRK